MNFIKKYAMKFLKIFSASLVLIAFMGFVKPEKWFLLKSEHFGYSVEFPKKPEENTQVVNSAIGELKMNMFMYDASEGGNDDNVLYLVNCTEYPDTLVHSDKTEQLEAFFEGAINGAVSNVQGKLLSKKEIQLGQYPGREMSIDYGNGQAIIRMRMYLVKNVMYMLQTIAETEKDNNASAVRFMDSFELLDSGAGGSH